MSTKVYVADWRLGTRRQIFTPHLHFLVSEGGEPQRLGLTVGRQIGGLRPHPDGRRLATTDFEANLEVWAMENFLPPLKVSK